MLKMTQHSTAGKLGQIYLYFAYTKINTSNEIFGGVL